MRSMLFFSKHKKLLLGSFVATTSFFGHKTFFCSEKQEIVIREEVDETKRKPPKKKGIPIGIKMSLVAAGIVGTLGVVIVPFLSPALRKLSAPFLPANDSLKDSMIQYCVKYGKKNIVDLGSGDGIIGSKHPKTPKNSKIKENFTFSNNRSDRCSKERNKRDRM